MTYVRTRPRLTRRPSVRATRAANASRIVLLTACICAWAIACTAGLRADVLVENVPIVGGTAVLARALGIDPAPDRARFVAELVRVLYDAPEGRSAASDGLRAKATAHLDAMGRLQAALAVAQPPDTVFSLSLAGQKDGRERLERFLDVVGLTLTQKNNVYGVDRAVNKEAVERTRLLAVLGIDLDQLAARLTRGESVRVEVPTESVPLPLSAEAWSAVVFQRPTTPSSLFAAVIGDRSAALICYGLAAVDDETLQFLSEQPSVVRRLYEEDAAVFATFGGSLHIRRNTVLIPGGEAASPLWESVLDAHANQPERFIRELFSRRGGRVAYLYDSLAQLDPAARAFALGLGIADPKRRLDRFESLLDAMERFPGWGVQDRPFSRPPDDAIVMLARVRADEHGVPLAPAWRAFWSLAFDGVDIPQNPARQLSAVQRDGVIDADWVASALLEAPIQSRAERLDQFSFGQRAFAGIADGALPDALVAVRAFPRYRMLVLTLERMGISAPGVYAAAVRHAERFSQLDAAHGTVALIQYQGALALLARLARVNGLDVEQRETLVRSLSALPITGGGYVGRLARWLRHDVMPHVGGSGDGDANIVAALAGRGRGAAAPPALVEWEERRYRLDLVEPEVRRMNRILTKLKARPVSDALTLEAIAEVLSDGGTGLDEINAACAQLKALPLEADPAAQADLQAAIRDLSKITKPGDARKAAQVGQLLFGLADEMLAGALRALTYAIDLGDASGARLIASDVSSRHDFGLAQKDNGMRASRPWAEPAQVVQTAVPWHLTGSLLGLDLGLSQTTLRRITSDAVPRPPTMLAAEQDGFAQTVSLLHPAELRDTDLDSIVDAINRGRQRVAQMGGPGEGVDAIADEIGMDGWRRRAVRWSLTNEPGTTLSFFSLSELLSLGRPPHGLSSSAWGAAALAQDGCLCTELPTPGRWAIMIGRSRGGVMSAQVADLNLRIAMALKELHLPAAIAKAVLAVATQDYFERVRPMYPDDWLTLVRAAQSIPTERIADYVAALTVDGPLASDTRPSSSER